MTTSRMAYPSQVTNEKVPACPQISKSRVTRGTIRLGFPLLFTGDEYHATFILGLAQNAGQVGISRRGGFWVPAGRRVEQLDGTKSNSATKVQSPNPFL